MQMAFFQIPVRSDAGLQEDLHRFLLSHSVLTVPTRWLEHEEPWGGQ